jgi:ParB family chromosome partitioning protein
MSDGEMQVLRESIRHDGQRLPITVQSGTGLIIDGRNRAQACADLGIEPKIVEVQCDDEGARQIAFQLNIARRHDGEMERAFIAAGLCNAPPHRPGKSLSGDRLSAPLVSAEKAASMVNLSTPTVSRAKKCRQADEKFFDGEDILEGLALGETKQSLLNLAWVASQLDKGDLDVDTVKAAAEKIRSGEDKGESDLKKLIKRELRAQRTAEALRAIQASSTGKADGMTVLPGQFWKLGRHILYCGDTSESTFRDFLPENAALAFADPPYGTSVTERPDGGDVLGWDLEFFWEHDYLEEKASIVAVTPGNKCLFDFARMTKMNYVCPHATWISNGMTVVGPMGYTNWICTFFFAKERKAVFGHHQDFLKVAINNAETGDTDHRGRKPMGLLVELINMYVKPSESQLIVDPFAGSGTTLLAAESSGVSCITGELDPGYCLSIIGRWQKMTGNKAELMA